MGTTLAIVPGVATAVWLSEYARPFWLARAVESAVEVVAATPSIVLAIFGLILFSEQLFSALSFTAEGGAVFGRSFFAASAMMALIALPLIVGGTREALQAIPRHVREALALARPRPQRSGACCCRRAAGDRDRHGARDGAHRGRHGDRRDPAGASLQLTGAGGVKPLDTLRGTGSTLTSYVFVNSPPARGTPRRRPTPRRSCC